MELIQMPITRWMDKESMVHIFEHHVIVMKRKLWICRQINGILEFLSQKALEDFLGQTLNLPVILSFIERLFYVLDIVFLN